MNEERNEEIRKLREQKLSQSEIATKMKLSICTIRHIIVDQLGMGGRAIEAGTGEFWRTNTPKLIELYTTTALSNTQLGEALGISRGAIAAQISRLLDAKAMPARVKAPVIPKLKATVVFDLGPPRKPTKPIPAAITALFAPEPARVPLLAIPDRSCRWPYDPAGDDAPWTFCGCKATRGPYCARHALLAFDAPQSPSPSCDPVAP